MESVVKCDLFACGVQRTAVISDILGKLFIGFFLFYERRTLVAPMPCRHLCNVFLVLVDIRSGTKQAIAARLNSVFDKKDYCSEC